MLELGGNIYFTAKLGATRRPFVPHLAAVMTGSTQRDYSIDDAPWWPLVEGNRSKSAGTSRQARPNPNRRHPSRGRNVARITAGVASSHVPAIGAAIDNKQTEEPYWKRVFIGLREIEGVDGEGQSRIVAIRGL